MQVPSHRATPRFWRAYEALTPEVQQRAEKQFALLKANPRHPSTQFKKIQEKDGVELWSARVTLSYRALAIRQPEGFLWFWIGDHTAYETLIG